MITKAQAAIVLLVLLTLITLLNAVVGAKNYYNFKDQVAQEHTSFRVAGKKIEKTGITNCEEIEVVKGAVRATITQAQHFTKSSPVRSQKEKELTEQYFKAVLDRFKSRTCDPHKEAKHASRILRKALQQH